MKEHLTMRDWCLNCKREQEVGEPFIYIELASGHVCFCSEKCEKEYRIKFKKLSKK